VNLATVQKRNPSRFRPWLEEHGSKLLLFARQQTRSLADAEDVLQEALVKLARKVEEGTFVGGESGWLPFIYTQIRRESIDLGRKDDRRRKREEKVVKDDRSLGKDIEMPLFEKGESQDETRRILVNGLETLPRVREPLPRSVRLSGFLSILLRHDTAMASRLSANNSRPSV